MINVDHLLFNDADHALFSSLSQDFNPLHSDPDYARRLPYGGTIVHGVHIVLRAFELLINNGYSLEHSFGVDCRFHNPINVNTQAAVSFSSANKRITSIEVASRDRMAVSVQISSSSEPAQHAAAPGQVSYATPMLESPSQILTNVGKDRTALADFAIRTPAVDPGYTTLFPSITSQVGWHLCYELGVISFLIGMYQPGLNSLLTHLSFKVSGMPSRRSSQITITELDRRFGLTRVCLAGSTHSEARAIKRPTAVTQCTITDLSTLVDDSQIFESTRAAVLGGSRGLGEVAAKLFVAAGGTVAITYNMGRDEATHIFNELNAYRPGSCSLHHCDITGRAIGLDVQEKLIDSDFVFYFATPPITAGYSSGLDDDLVQFYSNYYSAGFTKVVQLLGRFPSNRYTVFYPSTTFIDSAKSAFQEYAIAKSDGEDICAVLAKQYLNVKIHHQRLPPLKTDQTLTLYGPRGAEPGELMWKILTDIRSSPK